MKMDLVKRLWNRAGQYFKVVMSTDDSENALDGRAENKKRKLR